MARNPKPAVEGATEQAAGAADPSAEAVTAQMVAVVTATAPRRRRAGRSFGPTPTRIPVDQLTLEDREALAGDPVLTIRLEPAGMPVGD